MRWLRAWWSARVWPRSYSKLASVAAKSSSCSGGAQVYAQALSLADEMMLTHLPIAVEGDAYFPAWDEGEWKLANQRSEGALIFATYRRR